MYVGGFLTGLLVGTLLGLAVAPLLRAWIAWRVVQESRREAESEIDRRPERAEIRS